MSVPVKPPQYSRRMSATQHIVGNLGMLARVRIIFGGPDAVVHKLHGGTKQAKPMFAEQQSSPRARDAQKTGDGATD